MLTFDADTHTYTLDGVVVPSVTQILSVVTDDFFRRIPPDVLVAAQQRGIAVHRATELYDRGELDWSTVTEAVEPYLMGWVLFRDQVKPTVLGIEEQVCSARYRFAGTMDRRAVVGGLRAVLDIKTGVASTVGPQTFGYQLAYNERAAPENTLTHRFAVYLPGDGTYRLTRLEDSMDEAIFLSCLNVNNWRKRHAS